MDDTMASVYSAPSHPASSFGYDPAGPATAAIGDRATEIISQHWPSMASQSSNANSNDSTENEENLHAARVDVFSPPPRPMRPARQAVPKIIASKQQAMPATKNAVHTGEVDGEEDEHDREMSMGVAEGQADRAGQYSSSVPERDSSFVSRYAAPSVAQPDPLQMIRHRTDSEPSMGTHHYRSRSHFSIPDVIVTASEEDGNDTHFEVRLENAKRRFVISRPEDRNVTASSSTLPSFSLRSKKSSQEESNAKKADAKKKHRPPAIRIVNADGHTEQESPRAGEYDDVEGFSSSSPEAEHNVSSPTTTSTLPNRDSSVSAGKFGKRLRKSSLPNLFGKKDRDAANAAAMQALPPSPTYSAPQKSPTSPASFVSSTSSTAERSFANERAVRDDSGSKASAAHLDRRASSESETRRAGATVNAPVASPTLSLERFASPPHSPSPNATGRPYSPLSIFFPKQRSPSSPPSTTKRQANDAAAQAQLSKKELKQRQKEEKNMIKELEKVDKMVRKHDEKAQKAQRKAEKQQRKNGTVNSGKEVALSRDAQGDEEESTESAKARKTLNRITLFHANVSKAGQQRTPVPVRRTSIQRRVRTPPSSIHSSTLPSHGPSPHPHLMNEHQRAIETRQDSAAKQQQQQMPPRLEGVTLVTRKPVRRSEEKTADSEWTDVTSPVTETFPQSKVQSVEREAPRKLESANDQKSKAAEIVEVKRGNSVKRALAARKRVMESTGVRRNNSGHSRESSKAGIPTRAVDQRAPSDLEQQVLLPSHARKRDDNEARREQAARYRIESIVLDNGEFDWEDELSGTGSETATSQTLHSQAEERSRASITPLGSGQITPVQEDFTASADDKSNVFVPGLGASTKPLKPQQKQRASKISLTAASPLSLSFFDSLYKEVDEMESSFGKNYPEEAEVRRKSLVGGATVTNGKRQSRRMDAHISSPTEQSPRMPTREDFGERDVGAPLRVEDASMFVSPEYADIVPDLPPSSGVHVMPSKRNSDDSETSERRGRSSTGSSSATSSSSSSAVVPATPPIVQSFSFTPPTASMLERSTVLHDALPSHEQPASKPSETRNANGGGRKMRTGVNPRGFRFPPSPPSPVAVHQEAEILLDENGEHSYPTRASSLPLLDQRKQLVDQAGAGQQAHKIPSDASNAQVPHSISSPYAF